MLEEDRKKFAMNSFVYMPISLLLGFIIAAILINFMGFEIELGKFLLIIIFVLIIYISSILKYYRKLSKNKTNLKNNT